MCLSKTVELGNQHWGSEISTGVTVLDEATFDRASPFLVEAPAGSCPQVSLVVPV